MPGTDVTMALVAYWNEFGTTKIPARPAYRQFLAGGMVDQEAVVFGDAVAIADTTKAVNAALFQYAGALAEGLWKHVDAFTTPANAEATVKKKGFQDPLVESGRTRDSISWAVNRRGKRVKKGMAREPSG
jgi:hypothetical protein